MDLYKYKTTGRFEYDTYMPEGMGIRVRRLPEGDFCDALQVSTNGRFLEVTLPGESLPLGCLLEVEHGSSLYWGELQQLVGSTAIVCIEHSLDRSKLQPIGQIWGS